MCGLRLVPSMAEQRHAQRILGIIGQVVADFGFLSPLTQVPLEWLPCVAVESPFLSSDALQAVASGDPAEGRLTLAFDALALEAITSAVLACPADVRPQHEELRGTALELVNIACGRLLAGLYGTRHGLTQAPPRLAAKPKRLDGDWLRLRCESGQLGVRFQAVAC
jgi:hypothetical protein